MAGRLRERLRPEQWNITIIEENPAYYYQPGFLFLPFGIYSEQDVVRVRRPWIPPGVDYRVAEVDCIEAQRRKVRLKSGARLNYDILIIATGVKIAPEQTEGMLGSDWGARVFDFYTFEGASALRGALRNWNGGRLVVHITQMPIKCPVAPLEFAFLADQWLKDHRLRSRTEIVYVTPQPRLFSVPAVESFFGRFIEKKDVKVSTNFVTRSIDNERHKILSLNQREIDYDLLVTVPVNAGDVAIGRSGIADELNLVPTNPDTLQSKEHRDIFVLGDAADLPWPKSGSVIHFHSEILTENILHYIKEEPFASPPGGYAEWLAKSVENKAFPLNCDPKLQRAGKNCQLPVLGPCGGAYFSHFRELAFRWIYGTSCPAVWRCRELALGLAETAETVSL